MANTTDATVEQLREQVEELARRYDALGDELTEAENALFEAERPEGCLKRITVTRSAHGWASSAIEVDCGNRYGGSRELCAVCEAERAES